MAEFFKKITGRDEQRDKKMAYITRDVILNSKDIETEDVEVPEWGGIVKVKAMSGTERDAFEASIVDASAKGGPRMKTENIRAKLCVKTIVDPTSLQPMFTVADIEALGRKSAAALDRVYAVASRLSRVSQDDIEELEKNSGNGQSDTSS